MAQLTPDDLWEPMVHVESGGNPYARGKAGEIGLVQIKPSLAAQYGVPAESLEHPAVQRMLFNRIMGRYLQKYGNATQAVAAWNAGEGAVDRGHIPQGYISRVISAIGGAVGPTPAYAGEAPDLGVEDLGAQLQGEGAPQALAGAGRPPSPPGYYDPLSDVESKAYNWMARGSTGPVTPKQAAAAERQLPDYGKPAGQGPSYGPEVPFEEMERQQQFGIPPKTPEQRAKEKVASVIGRPGGPKFARAEVGEFHPIMALLSNMLITRGGEHVMDRTVDYIEENLGETLTRAGFPERDAREFAEGFSNVYRTPGGGVLLMQQTPALLPLLRAILVSGEVTPEVADIMEKYASSKLTMDAPRWQLMLRRFMSSRMPNIDWEPIAERATDELAERSAEFEAQHNTPWWLMEGE